MTSFKSETKEGQLWYSIRQRCSPKMQGKVALLKTYAGCSLSENFSNFEYFRDWCTRQIGFYSVDSQGSRYEIDKDLLLPFNKVYHEDVCVFIPHELNNFLIVPNKGKHRLPQGVSYHINRHLYVASCRQGGKNVHIGSFSNPKDAYVAYKRFKSKVAQELAGKFKNFVDPRVVERLQNFNVDDYVLDSPLEDSVECRLQIEEDSYETSVENG